MSCCSLRLNPRCAKPKPFVLLRFHPGHQSGTDACCARSRAAGRLGFCDSFRGRIDQPRVDCRRRADPGLRPPAGRAERQRSLLHSRDIWACGYALRADGLSAHPAPICLHDRRPPPLRGLPRLLHQHADGPGAGAFPAYLCFEHARHHAQPLHHGVHPEARAGPQRVAAPQPCRPSPGRLGRASESGFT